VSNLETHRTLDARIEAALAGEPLRPTPQYLHAAICRRAALILRAEEERRRFRRVAFTCGTALGGALIVGTLSLFMAADWLAYDVSGALGYLDYLVSTLPLSAGYALLPGLVWVGAPLFALIALGLAGARRHFFGAHTAHY